MIAYPLCLQWDTMLRANKKEKGKINELAPCSAQSLKLAAVSILAGVESILIVHSKPLS